MTFSQRVPLILFERQARIGLKREMPWDRVAVAENIFFFPVSALAHLHGVFFRVT